MKKKFFLIVITVLFAAIGSVGSVSVAANTEDANTEERKIESSHGRYWAKESFTVNNRKGTIKDSAVSSGNLYATRITLKIPPKESSEDISGSDTDAADQG